MTGTTGDPVAFCVQFFAIPSRRVSEHFCLVYTMSSTLHLPYHNAIIASVYQIAIK